MTTIKATLTESATMDRKMGHVCRERLIVAGVRNYAGFSVGYISEGESARKVFQGPLVPGPWAFAFANSAVMDEYGGTAAELRRMDAAGLVFRQELGDVIEVDGQLYTIEADHNNNIKLTPAKAETSDATGWDNHCQ